METYNYDDSNTTSAETASSQMDGNTASPGFGPAGPSTPSLSGGNDTTASPGPGPEGSVTPSLPSDNDSTAAPGLGPVGPVTPTLPSNNGSSCISCGSTSWPHTHTEILWTWGTLSPFFSTSSEISHLRFYNAASIQEPLDFYLNGRIVVSDLDYMNYTRFLHIIPGVYRLTVYRRTAPGMAIIDTNIRLLSGYSYTLAVLGSFGNYSIQMITS